jgi:protein disulfide-isomerase A6
MKPAYDQLGGEFAASSSVLIADVDCTVESDLCSKHDVKGYPTIKYYKDGDKKGADYNSGRDFDGLKKWVQENLEAKCDVADPKDCTDKEKKFIETMKAKDKDAWEKQIARLTKMKGDSMKAELKAWLMQRLNILTQLNK